MSDVSPGLELTWNQLNYAWERTPFLGLPAVISSLIRVFQSQEVRFNNKMRSGKLLAIISNALDLVVGIVTYCCVQGPPAFLMNIETLGVTQGRGYTPEAY